MSLCASLLGLLLPLLYSLQCSGNQSYQRLNEFQKRYNNSQSDLVFLMDTSGSVSNYGFSVEKKFISSLLSEISVQPDATRVAVITFGSDVKTEVDYIGAGGIDRNKCSFVKELNNIRHRYGLTNMNGGLLRAKHVYVDAARKRRLRYNVNRAVVMLTDGHWNVGGNPVNTAKDLRNSKATNAEIYSVGVGGYSYSELFNIAGVRSKVIQARNFNEFASLAARIRGDQIEKLYQPVSDAICNFECDPKAFCSCGTISGMHTCACKAGYNGNGKKQKCRPCPIGTYKPTASPDPCKPCPRFSSTTRTGSMSIKACNCFPGYRGNPGEGKPCKVVTCPDVPAARNGKLLSCGNEYKQTCTIQCNQHYHVAGEVATQRKLRCQSTGQWDKPFPICEPVKCQYRSDPLHTVVHCNGNTVGTKCTFTCKRGYIRKGPKEVTCRPDGFWSAKPPTCNIVQCSALRKIPDVEIDPPSCLTQKINFDSACNQKCRKGFQPQNSPLSRICMGDGTWSSEELICKDTTPPTIKCPRNIITETDPGKYYKEIEFEDATGKDNSFDEDNTVDISQKPLHIKSPYKFPIGATSIEYSATDKAGNKDKCTFKVEVQDTEKPKFIFCPQNREVTLDTGENKKKIEWKEPTYSDNSGQVKLLFQTLKSPQTFGPGIKRIEYRIRDAATLEASCEFLIKIQKRDCPSRDPPINGLLTCVKHSAYMKLCQVKCNSNYTFNGPVSRFYSCNYNILKWVTFPTFRPARWPDCTTIRSSDGTQQLMSFYYFSGSCHNNKAVRDKVKQEFIRLLSRVLRKIGQGGCENPANGRSCSTDNLVVICGKVQNGRRKRSNQNDFQIDVDIQVNSAESPKERLKAVEKVAKTLEELGRGSQKSSLDILNVAGDTLRLQKVQRVGNPTALCLKGAVYETGTANPQTKDKCVSCLTGRYYSVEEKKCKICIKGTYTETPGRIGCSNCPKGQTTHFEGTTKRELCKTPCSPGMYNKTGLEPCQACAKGTYQPHSGGFSCRACPGITTTSATSSKSLWECGTLCGTGTYSKTGVEPCLPCPRGFYSSSASAIQCTKCPSGLFTHGEGSTSVRSCVKINFCLSNPCMNRGSCTNEEAGFKCSCKPGFYGKRCEEEKNECQPSQCSKDSICVDLINKFECVCSRDYSGTYCTNRKKVCHATLCQNGGQCSDTPSGFSCSCPAGYTGVYCERTTIECSSSPCLNGGYCVDSHKGFSCQCAPGFNGERCEENIDDCEKNNLCLNNGVCVDGVNDFTCMCASGFAGKRCQYDVDECGSNPCRNGGKCVDKPNGYLCVCKPTFFGENCQKRKTVDNFDFEFDKKIIGFANKTLYDSIQKFTLAFWMKSSRDDTESGTPISYAVEAGGKFIDNAMVLRDVNSFILVIMGKSADLKFAGNDDLWHHIAVSWSSKTGVVAAYRDGLKVAEVLNFQKDQVIPGGGDLILGQEQDEIGRNFSAGEAFDGSISQLNIWNTVLSDAFILQMSRYRCDGFLGNLVAWPDFTFSMTDIQKTYKFCTGKAAKFTSWANRSPKSGSLERETSPCSSSSTYGQCVTLENRSAKEKNLFSVRCTKSSLMCSDAEEKKNNKNNPRCPDFKTRFECPTQKVDYCRGSSPCKNGGTCTSALSGYRCSCKDGYAGKQCELKVNCHQISMFPDGNVQYTNRQGRFSCNPGYELTGSGNLYCGAGKWNKPLPKCVDKDECKAGAHACQQICINTVGSYKCQCNKGYKLQGQNRCVDINECNIKNGNCQDKCFNTEGGYRCGCRSGYRISADKHSCEDIDNCKNDQHNCDQVCVNTRGSYKCDCRPGFKLSSDKKSCNRIKCPSLQSNSYVGITKTGNTFESTATYRCLVKGHKLMNSPTRRCLANGQWSGSEPVCQVAKCTLPGSVFSGIVKGFGNSFNSKYTITCLSGYRRIGSQKIVCQQNSEWSAPLPRCVVSICRPLSPPANGKVIGNSLANQASVLIKCNVGYRLENLEGIVRTCQSNGQWSGVQSGCKVVNCGAPPKLGNGTIIGRRYTYGKTLTYKCKKGYGLSGLQQRTCEADGKWSGLNPVCLYRSCGYPGEPVNGKLIGKDFQFDKVVKYECNTGYILDGVKERICLSSGVWSDSKPKCNIVKCGDPGIPSNGERHGSTFTWKSTVKYDCKPGFSLVGATLLECKANGKWTGSAPECKAGVCGASNLIGPSGKLSSPGYPNVYPNNLYCRWAIKVSNSKKAKIHVTELETEKPDDMVVIRDGENQKVITILSGKIKSDVSFTSSSNKLDVKFLSGATNIGSPFGFSATYSASVCGGHITTMFAIISTPNYPRNYPADILCTWQFNLQQPFKLKFKHFKTFDQYDTLEIYDKVSEISKKTFRNVYVGYRGSLSVESKTGELYLRFKTNEHHNSSGFQAIVEKP